MKRLMTDEKGVGGRKTNKKSATTTKWYYEEWQIQEKFGKQKECINTPHPLPPHTHTQTTVNSGDGRDAEDLPNYSTM